MEIERRGNRLWLRLEKLSIPFTTYEIDADIENVVLFNMDVMCGSLWNERCSEFSKLIVEVEAEAA